MPSSYIPLKSALARARAVYHAEGNQILSGYIKSGRLRLRAKLKTVIESDTCYRFSLGKTKLFLKTMPMRAPGQTELEDEIQALLDKAGPKGELSSRRLRKIASCRTKIQYLINAHKEALGKQNALDAIAYELAYGEDPDSLNEKVLIYRAEAQIILWTNLAKVSEVQDSSLSVACQNEYGGAVRDYIAEMNFSADYTELEMIRIQLFPYNKHARYSVYRCQDTVIITQAKGLTCLKSDVEELFPRTRPESARKPGNQPLFDEAELKKLFVHLDAVFSDRASTPSRVAVSDAIQRYRDDPEGGPGKTALNDYANKYLEYRKKKSAK